MSAQPQKQWTPEERASYRAWLFGSQLDWGCLILAEINYPVAENKWHVDAVQALCQRASSKARVEGARLSHGRVAKRAGRYMNKTQARELVKAAIERDGQWSREHRRKIFDVERPKPTERSGSGKRLATRYTDYLTPAVIWAQDIEHKVKKSDELRWRKDKQYRAGKRREILNEAIKMLPSWDASDVLPVDGDPPDKKPLPLNEYIEQRAKILKAESKRILDRICDGELISADEINERLALLDTHQADIHEADEKIESARKVLLGLRETVLTRAANMGEAEDAPEHDPLRWAGDVQPLSKEDALERLRLAPNHDAFIAAVLRARAAGASEEEVDAACRPADPSLELGGNTLKGYAEAENPEPEPAEESPNKGYADLPLLFQSKLEAALWNMRQGLPVHPNHWIKPDGSCSCIKGVKCPTPGKHPLLSNWQNLPFADEQQVREWWKQWPDANPGIITGREVVPGWRLGVLDVDAEKGGTQSYLQLFEGEEIPRTRTIQSGSKTPGVHQYFIYPADIELRNVQASKTLGEGLDIRAEGGNLIAPGAVHKSGNTYEVIDLSDYAPMPDFIIEKLRSDVRRERGKRPAVPIKAGVYPVSGSLIRKGGRNTYLFSVCSAIWNTGATEDEMYAKALAVRDAKLDQGVEPFTDARVWAVVQSVYRQAKKDGWVMRPQETNAEPEEAVL